MPFYPAHAAQTASIAQRERSSRLAAGALVFVAHGLAALLLLFGIARQVPFAAMNPPMVMAELSRATVLAHDLAPPTVHLLRVAPVTAAAPEISIQADTSAAPVTALATSTLASAPPMATGAASGAGSKAGTAPSAAAGSSGTGSASRAAGGTGGYDLSDYLARVSRHIQRHLVAPMPFSQSLWRHDFSGMVLVHLIFRADGSVQKAEIARSSGTPMYDEAALAAVRRSNPVPAFPPEVKLDQINGIIPVFFSTTGEMKPYCTGSKSQADLVAGKCLLP